MSRVLFLSLLLSCLPYSSLSAVEASVFERTATLYAEAVRKCWGVTKGQPSRWERRQILKACQKWASMRWPDHVEIMRERLYRLYLSEGENPSDPSYGWWGVTLKAARHFGNMFPVTGYKLPKSDKELIRRLRHDIDFNCYVASAELKACMADLPMNYETKSIMRYKLGVRGERQFHEAKRIRRRMWFAIRRQWRCIKDKAEAERYDTCECMRESKREHK